METEYEKMLSGKPYDASAPELLEKLNRIKDLLWEYNNLRPSLFEKRTELIQKILGKTGREFFIVQPFYCDYGRNIEIGDKFFANFSLTILDEAKVTIGDNVFIGPNVGIYTACHPLGAKERNECIEWAKPVSIGSDVWIGAGVTILPGVSIGKGATVGAGSVVVKDVTPYTVVAGNPANVIKKLLIPNS